MKSCGFEIERKEKGDVTCPDCQKKTLQAVAIPIPITFHNLRSTFASWAYAHTRDIRFVQMMLGHSDTKVTERYAAAMNDSMRRLANQVSLNPFEGVLPSGAPALPSGAQVAREEALEDAARECDRVAETVNAEDFGAIRCAAAIRKLKRRDSDGTRAGHGEGNGVHFAATADNRLHR
jgi:hypothetical protein